MNISYIRVSTKNQTNKDNIQIQIDSINEYAKKNNIIINKAFSDNGISGKNDIDEREGLAELLEFIDDNNVEKMIIFKLDRLSREIGLQEYIIKQLSKKNVQLISIHDKDISNDPQRKLFRVLLGAIAEYELSMINLRMSLGRKRKAKQGGYAGGGIPYGYKTTNDNQLIIDNTIAENVKKIFYMKRYKRMSLNSIAITLNRENIETAKGGKWYASTIQAILNNKIYTKGIINYKGIVTQNSKLRLI